MSPLGLALFFTFMTLAEGGGQRALKRKFLEVARISGVDRLMIGILAFTKGELLYLACCADHQFQVYAIATPNPFCQYGRSLLVRFLSRLEVTVGTCI
jgi:hypothetical protein